MVQKISGHYVPLWDEIVGVIKVFFLIWVVAVIIFFIVLGVNKWAFWGAVGIGFLTALVITVILSLATGVTTLTLPFSNKEDKK